jgi:BirA family biotin operon repressor/biotin-[acetyl-CoA-carboxylase] ligase
MHRTDLPNPFGAPVYHEETVSSTMDLSRILARRGEPHGTVITADFQEAGRGRVPNRPWRMDRGQNLSFTILLKFPDFSALPQALTLRTGLAVSLAVEDFAPALSGTVEVKWPNDIMIVSRQAGTARKAAGILTEAEDAVVYIGIGVNLGQREFPPEYRNKAGSIALALEDRGHAPAALSGEDRFRLLETILLRLHGEIGGAALAEDWRQRLEMRLYRRGETVRFMEGAADSGKAVEGRLDGIGSGGELLITPVGEKAPRPYVTGELQVYQDADGP